MSIDLTKPITCNGQPVEVLTGWTNRHRKWFNACLVEINSRLYVLWENGEVSGIEEQYALALNSRPIDGVKP